MKQPAVLLDTTERNAVEVVIKQHCLHRGWTLHAVSARSNHVHVAVSASVTVRNTAGRPADGIKRVRDQLKANATRVLRGLDNPLKQERVWTKGGDIQVIDSIEDLEHIILYITEAQDRMDRKQ